MTNFTRVVFFLFVLTFFTSTAFSQDVWDRQAEIPVPEPSLNTGGIGNMITNVDLDNDGNMDLYVISHNWNDAASEFTPRAYKYEDSGSGWEIVWQAEFTTITQQNSWPGITVGDLDGDGKGELIYGPVNWSPPANDPNAPRVLVYETPGDGSDDMGVSDGFGGFLPNTTSSITDQDGVNLRPFRFLVEDIIPGGNDELLFCDRTATSSGWSFGVLSVSDVPDNGDGSETWTVEANGLTVGLTPVENKWDIAVLDSVIYLFDEVECSRVVYHAGTETWEVLPGQPSVLAGAGSWKSAQVLDVDGNAQKEIVVGNWFSTENTGIWVYEYDADGDSLVGTLVVDLAEYSTSYGVYGGAYGDIDNNGKMDFVFGSRNSIPSNATIFRAEYVGAQDAVSNPANWELSIIDSAYTDGGRWGIIQIADVDDDFNKEVLYTSSVPDAKDELVPIIVLNLPVELNPGPWSRVPFNATFEGTIASGLGNANGIAVDGDGNVWAASYGGTLNKYTPNGDTLLVIDSLTVPKKTGDGDTTVVMNNVRGLGTDRDGNILFTRTGRVHLINKDDGTSLNWLEFAGSPGAPEIDDQGFIYVDLVVGISPIKVIDPETFTYTQDIVIDPLPSGGTFSRGMYVSLDGKRIVPANLDAGIHSLYVYESTDFISYPLADSIKNDVDGLPLLLTQSVTMDRTPDDAMWVSQDNAYITDYDPNNVLQRFDFNTFSYSEVPIPPLPGDEAPNANGVWGAAWSPDGQTMYACSRNAGRIYKWSGNFFTPSTLEKNEEVIPVAYKLDQNYPNPFNPTTDISFTITQAKETSLKIFNVLGQEVTTLVNKKLAPGSYSYSFDASKLASGTYIYKLESGDFVANKKMTLVK
jgi:hypothetical protein